MKNPNPHDGYAPDLFSEHARAAQFGLRVLEIMRSKPTPHDMAWYGGPTAAKYAAVYNAAHELGLVHDEKGGAK